jgi:hypothetical protein
MEKANKQARWNLAVRRRLYDIGLVIHFYDISNPECLKLNRTLYHRTCSFLPQFDLGVLLPIATGPVPSNA